MRRRRITQILPGVPFRLCLKTSWGRLFVWYDTSMKKLLLFDIDGTLLTGGGHDRFSRTISKVHGLDLTSDKDFRGYTDYLILAALLESEGWDDEQIKATMPKLLEEMDKMHAETFHADDMKLLPGVKKLLDKLKETESVLGLITGNMESIAKRKLEALGIWDYFSLGGYGSDPHIIRADLVKIAIERAGFKDNIKQVYVIGDTAKDIEAAHTAGVVNSIGVANGFRDIKELSDAGAKYIFEDFKN